MEIKELKDLLENTARDSNLKIVGETSLKSPQQKQAEEEINDWKEERAEKIIPNTQYEIYKDYVNLLLGGKINALICFSKTGFGKTYTTINLLRGLKKEFSYKSGYITPLSFYEFLYENRNALIVLDDLTEDIFRDRKMIALLKSCLYEAGGKRFVSYDTSAELKVPKKFNFNGKIIILANEIGNKETENFNALISRSIFFNLEYSFSEIMRISNKIIKRNNLTNKQVKKVNEIIKKNITEVSEFNFRQLEKLIEMVKYNISKAESLFCHSFKTDEELKVVLELMKLPLSVKEQAERYNQKTGYSIRKYYRLKKKVKLIVKNDTIDNKTGCQ